MKPCPQFRENIALLAAGVLEENLRAPLKAHQEHCPGCRQYLNAMLDVCREQDLTAQRLPPLKPSSSFHHRLVERIREEAPLTGKGIVDGWMAWMLAPRWRLALPAAAVVLILLGLVSWNPRASRPVATVDSSQPQENSREQVSTRDWLSYRLAANQSPEAFEALLARDAAIPSSGAVRITAGTRELTGLTE